MTVAGDSNIWISPNSQFQLFGSWPPPSTLRCKVAGLLPLPVTALQGVRKPSGSKGYGRCIRLNTQTLAASATVPAMPAELNLWWMLECDLVRYCRWLERVAAAARGEGGRYCAWCSGFYRGRHHGVYCCHACYRANANAKSRALYRRQMREAGRDRV